MLLEQFAVDVHHILRHFNLVTRIISALCFIEKERDLDKADVVTNGPLLVGDREAGGDGTEALRTTKVPPGKSGKVTIVAEYDDDDDDDGVDVDDIDYIVDECEIIDDIPVAEPPIIDIENTNNNDDLD